MRLVSAAAITLLLASLPVTATEKVSHYEAKASETLADAMANLREYNTKVEAVMARDPMTPSDMEEVHQYTYTMEQAVARIIADMDTIAAALEEVHLSSEGADPAALRETAATYLDMTAPLTE